MVKMVENCMSNLSFQNGKKMVKCFFFFWGGEGLLQ